MATNDEVHRELFTKVGTLANSVSELSGAVAVLNKTNTELTITLRRANFYQFVTILFLIAVIAYGAIGERGLYAVRDTVPSMVNRQSPYQSPLPIPDGSGEEAAIAPAPMNDLEKYTNTQTKG